jgi:hypothetical protein
MTQFFAPKSWQFWSSPLTRPKRVYEGLLLFSDLMFGGEGINSFPPFLVKRFSRPGYTRIQTKTAKYQLRSGDFAKIDYPTQEFTTDSLRVELIDVNVFGSKQGPDTAGHINAALGMMQKTWYFEDEAAAHEEGSPSKTYDLFINGYIQGNPKIITILELSGKPGIEGILGTWNFIRPILTRATFSDISYEGQTFGTVDLDFEYKNFYFEQGWSNTQLDSRLKAAAAEQSTLIADSISKAAKWASVIRF